MSRRLEVGAVEMSRSVLGRWQKEAACVKRFQIKLIVKKSNILINSVICDVKLFNCYLIEERVIFPAFKEERTILFT